MALETEQEALRTGRGHGDCHGYGIDVITNDGDLLAPLCLALGKSKSAVRENPVDLVLVHPAVFRIRTAGEEIIDHRLNVSVQCSHIGNELCCHRGGEIRGRAPTKREHVKNHVTVVDCTAAEEPPDGHSKAKVVIIRLDVADRHVAARSHMA